MKKIVFILFCLSSLPISLKAKGEENVIRLTLKEAMILAQLQSVDATVALNELKTAYWQYRTHLADQLPEVNLRASLPAYEKTYNKYQKEDGSYTYLKTNALNLNGEISVDQNVPLTGGKVSLVSSLDFTRQLGLGAANEYMSIPVGITFKQPIFGVNIQKWERRIEPIRYQEAKAAYLESVEDITRYTINYFFYLLAAKENLAIAKQNLENAEKLYEIAEAKRKIGHISENELMQLNLSALQAKATVTDAQSSLNAYMFQLRAFLGLSEEDIIDPVTPESVSADPLVYNQVLIKAQENNSFAKEIIRRQLEAEYEVAIAKGNRRQIELFASFGYTGKDKILRDAYNDLMTNQIVEVGVSIPLLDWGKRKGQVKVAESNRDVVLSRIRQEELNFNQNIYLLVENFNNQAAQLEIARQADLIAQKRYQTSIETFMIGKINILDLNDARNSKDEARQTHIEELRKYWSYFYQLRSITLYDFVNGTNLDADIAELVRR